MESGCHDCATTHPPKPYNPPPPELLKTVHIDDWIVVCDKPSGLLSVQVLNTTKEPIRYDLQVGDVVAKVEIPANALQTVRVQT